MSNLGVESQTTKALPGLTRTLDRVLALAAATIRFDCASIRLAEGGHLRVEAFYPRASAGAKARPEELDFASTEALCNRVRRTGQTVRFGDVLVESRVAPGQKRVTSDDYPVRSFLGIPLLLDGDVVGVLELTSHRRELFQERDLEHAEAIAEQVVFAVRHARLEREHRLLAQRQERLIESLALIRSTPDIRSLVRRVVEQAVTLVEAAHGAIALIENGRLVFQQDPELDRWAPAALRDELARRLSGTAGSESREQFSDFPSTLIGDAAGPVLSVPFHDSRNRPLGLLLMHHRPDDRRFDESERELLEVYAGQVAVIVENIRLLREAEERRTEIRTLKEFSDHLVETIPTGIAVLDREHRFTRVNPAYCQIVNRPASELLGRQLTQVFPKVNETEMLDLLNRVWEHGETVIATDYHYPYLSEGAAWFDLSLVPIVGRGGTVEAVMVAITDITGRRRLEADLRQRNEMIQRQLMQHRALYEIGTQVNAELDLARVLEAIMVSIRLVFGVDGLSIYMPQTRNPLRFERVSAIGLSERYLEVEERYYIEYAGGIATRQRSPMLITNVAQDPRLGPLREAAIQEGLCTLLLLPFVYREEVVGLMRLYHKRPHDYSLEEMELLAIFASQATAAVKNAQLHQSVLESTINLNAILESITYGVIAFNSEDRVIFTNRRFYELLDFDSGVTLIGKTSEELLESLASQTHPSITADALRAVASQAEGRSEIFSDAPPLVLEIVTTPILSQGDDTIGRLVLFHDITEMRRNERLKDEIISIISHELRTPLTSILGYSKLLVDRVDMPAEKRGRWARFILEKSRLLNRLMNDVLDLSRLNMGRFELLFGPVDLVQVVGRVTEEFSISNERREIKVDVVGEPTPIEADRDRLEQVIANLLSNAIKYSPDDSPILVRIEESRNGLALSVTDRGIGIAPEHLARIFEPFYRVDNSTTRAVYGTGLGLTISQGIVNAHGGMMSVESTPGEGTTVWIFLPRRPTGEGGLHLPINS